MPVLQVRLVDADKGVAAETELDAAGGSRGGDGGYAQHYYTVKK